MSITLIRYALDPTGVNPNNHVTGEVHTLSAAQIRSVAPDYGPFYSESMVVYDHGTNTLLVRGTHYQFVDLLQDPSLQFGQEICQLITILDSTVSNQVRLDYQVLGGYYQNSSKAIGDLFETFLADNRPVDWTSVLNKPYQYPPTLHPHQLFDVTGFGPLVVAIERVTQAVTLSSIPAMEELIDWVTTQLTPASEQEIKDMALVDKVMTLKQMIYATKYLNFNSVKFRSNTRSIILGNWFNFTISSTNFNHSETLYWTLRSVAGLLPEYFSVQNGPVNVVEQEGSFNLTTILGTANHGVVRFIVELRRNSTTGPVVAESAELSVILPSTSTGDAGSLSRGLWDTVCCLMEPDIQITPESMYLVTFDQGTKILKYS